MGLMVVKPKTRPGSCTSKLQMKVNCRPEVNCRMKFGLAQWLSQLSKSWYSTNFILQLFTFGLQSDMFLPKVQICPVLPSYQMWFCQKLLKKAKTNRQIVKIWLFLWNWPLPVFWLFWAMFGQKLLKNTKKPEVRYFSATRCEFSQK